MTTTPNVPPQPVDPNQDPNQPQPDDQPDTQPKQPRR
jgi:hypothetical protein